MNRIKLTALGLALSLGMVGGMASAAELSRGDTKFLEKAAVSGMLEIEASKLAQERAQSQEVKDFAKMMVTDHTKVDEELKALAGSKNVKLPAELPRGERNTVKDLSEKSGHDFDEEYAEEIAVDAHEDAVDEFKDAAEDAKDADVKAFAAKHLPALEQHLAKGKALKEAVDKMDDNNRTRATGAGTANTPATGATSPASPAMPASNNGTPSTNPAR